MPHNPANPSVGALEGLAHIVDAAGLRLSKIGEIVHGTTLVANALIKRRGARLGFITTAGFRDILEIGTEQRYDIYDLFLRYPDPRVPRRRRVPERIDRNGNTIIPLDRNAVRDAARRLAADGIEAIMVSFLYAYRNPSHERDAGAIIRAALPDIAVSLSSGVVAEKNSQLSRADRRGTYQEDCYLCGRSKVYIRARLQSVEPHPGERRVTDKNPRR